MSLHRISSLVPVCKHDEREMNRVGVSQECSGWILYRELAQSWRGWLLTGGRVWRVLWKFTGNLSIAQWLIFRVTILLTFWRRNWFFLIFGTPVYKMWIIQEPNTLELWNKWHFEEKKTKIIYHVYKMWIIQEPNTLELWNKLHFEEKKTNSIYHVYEMWIIQEPNALELWNKLHF